MTRRTLLGLVGGAVTGPFVLRHRIADAAVDPAVVGTWSPRVKLPHIAIHMSALPGSASLLMAFAILSGTGTKAWTYDPTTNIVTDCTLTQFPYDFMCGGGILDERGSFRVYGGRTNNDRSARFNAATLTWSEGKKLSETSYYPTTIRVGQSVNYPEGAILTAVGRRKSIDIYSAHDYDLTTRMAKMPASANLAELGYQQQYPRLHLLPNGRVVMVGCERPMKTLDIDTATWTTIGTMLWGRRYEGCATRLPGDGYEFLLTGGDIAATSKRQERFNARTGVGRETAPMTFMRKQANTVLLPDGTVLILGGLGSPNPNAPELYNPLTETCRVLADTPPSSAGNPKPSYRGYHSTAALLRDGRVIWAGGVAGTAGYSSEIFTPPQLYAGPRPSLSITPGMEVITYGGMATMSSPSPELIHHIALIRPSHNSHGHNGEQQHYTCETLTFQDGTVQALMPGDRNLAPPGWYVAYAVSQAGVWSAGQDLRLM